MHQSYDLFYIVHWCTTLHSVTYLFLHREDLACRLPEMEQPGSDQENLDSETSQSSESLLDELQRSSVHSSEPDGQYFALPAWISLLLSVSLTVGF